MQLTYMHVYVAYFWSNLIASPTNWEELTLARLDLTLLMDSDKMSRVSSMIVNNKILHDDLLNSDSWGRIKWYTCTGTARLSHYLIFIFIISFSFISFSFNYDSRNPHSAFIYNYKHWLPIIVMENFLLKLFQNL